MHPCITIYPISNGCMIRRQTAGRQAPIEEWDLQLVTVWVSSGPAWQCTSESIGRPLMQTHDSHVAVALEGPSPWQYSGRSETGVTGKRRRVGGTPYTDLMFTCQRPKAIGASRRAVGLPRLTSQSDLDSAHADRSFYRVPDLRRDSYTN